MDKQTIKKHHRYINWVKYMIGWVHQDSRPPVLLALKGNSKFEILLGKIFSLKRKAKSNTSCYYEKNQIFTLQENSLWFFSIRDYNG